jgi:hypothetical protein
LPVFKINGIALGNMIMVKDQTQNIMVGQVIKLQYSNEKKKALRRYTWKAVIFELNKNVEVFLSPTYELTNEKFQYQFSYPAMIIFPCNLYVCHINMKTIEPSKEEIFREILKLVRNFVKQFNNWFMCNLRSVLNKIRAVSIIFYCKSK